MDLNSQKQSSRMLFSRSLPDRWSGVGCNICYHRNHAAKKCNYKCGCKKGHPHSIESCLSPIATEQTNREKTLNDLSNARKVNQVYKDKLEAEDKALQQKIQGVSLTTTPEQTQQETTESVNQHVNASNPKAQNTTVYPNTTGPAPPSSTHNSVNPNTYTPNTENMGKVLTQTDLIHRSGPTQPQEQIVSSMSTLGATDSFYARYDQPRRDTNMVDDAGDTDVDDPQVRSLSGRNQDPNPEGVGNVDSDHSTMSDSPRDDSTMEEQEDTSYETEPSQQDERPGSFNIQKTKNLEFITELATNYDIFFIQEFQASTNNVRAVRDYAKRADLQFFTGHGSNNKNNQTGILVKTKKVKILGFQELELISDHSRFSSDVRVQINTGEMILFQNLYLPTKPKSLQMKILEDSKFCFDLLKEAHPSLSLFYGGDLNHSVENPSSEEKKTIQAINDLNTIAKTQDIALYDPKISTCPTNQPTNELASCRRLDRFYAPKKWRKRAWTYEITKPGKITSTHHMISVKYVLNKEIDVQMGRPRFQFPEGRLLPPFDATRTKTIDPGRTMEEALSSMKSDGMEYIQLMGSIRKHNPRFADQIINDHSTVSAEEFSRKAYKTFFRGMKPEKHIFTKLINGAKGKSADDTADMLALAKEYYEDLYKQADHIDNGELEAFMEPLRQSISPQEQTELDRPFTANELLSALKSSNRGTAPGPDGLHYHVLRHYWKEISPILTRTANEIMRTGKLPECFQTVLITLLPKKDFKTSTDIKDVRPISLSSTSLKVISKAVCKRLQKVMEKLIGPGQRGFMKGRRISQNTIEVFTMIDLVKKVRETETHSDCQAILMADFMKAFDRISHQYMEAVLEKVGFGPSLKRLLMSIMKDQIAQIQMNDCWGIPFPMRCGTRQGNPLSPLIFNLALEPFLCHLDKLKGLPLVYETIPLQRIKYHAFADDVNVYLDDAEDYAKVSQIISDYEKVSNSKVSSTKSVLLGFYDGFAALRQNILPFPQTYIGTVDMKYLGIHFQGVDWKSVLASLPISTVTQGYSQLAIIERAKGTVAYISSKVVYTDLVQCMTQKELVNMDNAIKKVFPYIGKDKILARPKKGGYGILEMTEQMQGHRAFVLITALTDNQDWYTLYLKLKILHHMTKLLSKNKWANINGIGGLSLADFLFERTGKFFRNLDWTFTPSEKMYMEAWKKVVPRTRLIGRKIPLRLSSSTLVKQHAKSEEHLFISREEYTAIAAVEFKSLSKRKQEALSPIVPTEFTKIYPEVNNKKRWKKFWESLYKHEWLARHDFMAIHLFNFGSYVPIHNTTPEIPGFKCHLCLQNVSSEKILIHLYNECERVKILWHKVGFEQPMNLGEMLAPIDRKYENLRKLNWFVKIVRKVYALQQRRAASGQTLVPLSHRSLYRTLRRTDPMGR
ncbi:hypothetical protein JCM33374_g2981 [Metschnikowia sp. JCM 33374]|nr:hypothetical protein JCM33374_g2981 [Metschnikowia sp. JCM 33374]